MGRETKTFDDTADDAVLMVVAFGRSHLQLQAILCLLCKALSRGVAFCCHVGLQTAGWKAVIQLDVGGQRRADGSS